MSQEYAATAAQVIPVLLLAGVAHGRLVFRPARPGASAAEPSGRLRDVEEMRAVLDRVEHGLRQRHSRRGRLLDRFMDVAAWPMTWLTQFIAPTVGVIGEMQAIGQLSTGGTGGTLVISVGLYASVAYAGSALVIEFIQGARNRVKTIRTFRRYDVRLLAEMEAEVQELQQMLNTLTEHEENPPPGTTPGEPEA